MMRTDSYYYHYLHNDYLMMIASSKNEINRKLKIFVRYFLINDVGKKTHTHYLTFSRALDTKNRRKEK